MWRKRTTKGFIWVHGSKFKAGYPDVSTIVNGVECHYELKIGYNTATLTFTEITKLFEPIQIITLNAIAEACGRARGLVLRPDKTVVLVDFNVKMTKVYQDYEFEYAWMKEDYL